MRSLSSLTFVALISITAACGSKKKDGGSADKPAEGSTDQPAGPVTLAAPALFDDFNAPGKDGMALLDKYRPGVVTSGAVTNTITEMDNSMTVWLDAGNGHHVSLGFKDNGAAASKKGVKAGDQVSAQCSVGGSDGKMMMLIDCDLK
ncbi:MAG TPA: hypothetical protein VL463_04990 [Kofleriaceae bacterium]|jgi:hypothetical protein|nr:hypothetical protein [Kofleriaceae bacterium]